MSVFTNTTTNTTAPYKSCSYLGAISPPANNTLASCSIPDCEDNRGAVGECCSGGTISTFNEFRNVSQQNITINAEYLVCTFDENISGYTDLTPYAPNETVFALPDCLVRNGGSRFVCNRPNPNSDYRSCSWGGYQTAQGTGEGATTCDTNNNNENLTSVLSSCCQSSGGTLRAEQEGCAVSCSGDDTLTSCMADGYSRLRGSVAGSVYGCGNHSETGSASTLGGSGKTTLASVLLAVMATAAMLQ